MEPRPATPPPWLPVPRPDQPLVHAQTPAEPSAPGDPPPAEPQPPDRPFSWRRLTRSRRGAAGLGIAAAALLLSPFADWVWLPWLAGLGALLLLRLLRLDGLLHGWAPHLAGLVVVAGLMMSTGPWAWALAASIGVLLAGLVQLPWWRLAAVGAMLCVISGVGFTWANIDEARDAAAAHRSTQEGSKKNQGAIRAEGVLPTLLNRIAQASPGAVCDNLLAEPARAPFAASVGETDCGTAVRVLASRVSNKVQYSKADAPAETTPDGLVIDACTLSWGGGPAAGPQLGHLTVGMIAEFRYVVTEFRAC